jgi:hypothetical protein
VLHSSAASNSLILANLRVVKPLSPNARNPRAPQEVRLPHGRYKWNSKICVSSMLWMIWQKVRDLPI